MCYLCRQPVHFRRDCPRRQESQGFGTPQSQSSVRRVMVASQDGQMVCYHCQQPGHMRSPEVWAGIPRFGDGAVPVSCGTGADTVCFSIP